MSFLTTGDEICGLCGDKVRQLYPLTHYDPKIRRWRPVRVGRCCLGEWNEYGLGYQRHQVRLDQMLRFPKGRAVEPSSEDT
jgi:hypothetical protein